MVQNMISGKSYLKNKMIYEKLGQDITPVNFRGKIYTLNGHKIILKDLTKEEKKCLTK